MVSEPKKEELVIDRTYFKISNPEEEEAKRQLEQQQLEAFKKLLERLKEIQSKNPAQELIQKLIEERLREELEKAMRNQSQQESQEGENGDGSQDGNQQEGQQQSGESQSGENEGNQQSEGQGGNSTGQGEGPSDGEIMGYALSEGPVDPNAPSISINLPGKQSEEEKSETNEEDGSGSDGEDGETLSDNSGESNNDVVSEKDFTRGGSTHGAKEIEDKDSKKITVSKKTRFR